MKNKKAIHFGAGNIGRGFVGTILHESGYSFSFVDISKDIVSRLQATKKYPVRILGKNTLISIPIVEALLFDDSSVPMHIANTDLITCAIGPPALPTLAKIIALGTKERIKQNITTPNFVIACENMLRPSSVLKKATLQLLDTSEQLFLNQHTIFLDSVVNRIVLPDPNSPPNSDDIHSVVVEEFCEWVVEKPPQIRVPDIAGVTYVEELQPYIERKLFTVNTTHCFAAWLGAAYNITNVTDCFSHPVISPLISEICAEVAEVLLACFDLERDAHYAYVNSILHRFKNPELVDTVARVGRTPMRKLGENERFVLPLKYALTYKTKHTMLLLGIALGLWYRNEEDQESVEIKKMLQNNSVAKVFKDITTIHNDDLANKVEAAYHQLPNIEKAIQVLDT